MLLRLSFFLTYAEDPVGRRPGYLASLRLCIWMGGWLEGERKGTARVLLAHDSFRDQIVASISSGDRRAPSHPLTKSRAEALLCHPGHADAPPYAGMLAFDGARKEAADAKLTCSRQSLCVVNDQPVGNPKRKV
jgi:hypothetical protein